MYEYISAVNISICMCCINPSTIAVLESFCLFLKCRAGAIVAVIKEKSSALRVFTKEPLYCCGILYTLDGRINISFFYFDLLHFIAHLIDRLLLRLQQTSFYWWCCCLNFKIYDLYCPTFRASRKWEKHDTENKTIFRGFRDIPFRTSTVKCTSNIFC